MNTKCPLDAHCHCHYRITKEWRYRSTPIFQLWKCNSVRRRECWRDCAENGGDMHSALCKEENVQAGTNGGEITLCKMCTGANGGDVVHTLKSGKCTNRPARMSERYCTLKRGKCTGWPARMPRRYCTAGKKVAATIRPWGSSLYNPISPFHTCVCKFLWKFFTNIYENNLNWDWIHMLVLFVWNFTSQS